MEKITETLKNLQLKDEEEKRAVIFAKNFMIAMSEAMQQIKEEADQALHNGEDYTDHMLSYSDMYSDDAFSGLSRAADILNDKMRKITFIDCVSRETWGK